ncbi:hypothetical protein PMAYCL1PPCAC_24133 [Pristionchus mayeri]|uniref:C2H2-type domain-containing protein n=1 Tax=Pristionchus mayeri TaxID=1317129 RepID=A0AAN5I6B3_9BILA|nr:hypothetical protein PMAYCL1PPCAC_24133 [Pristionchus mayeri]
MHFSTPSDGPNHYSPEQAATNVMSSSSPPLEHHSSPSDDPSSMTINEHLRSLPSPPPHESHAPPSTVPPSLHWTPASYGHQDPSTSMLDGGYGSSGVQTGSATCQQLDQMLVRMHSSASSSPINNNVGDMKNIGGLPDAHQLKNEPLDSAYPLSSLNCLPMPGFEILSSPYASSRTLSEGSLVGLQHMRRGSRSAQDGFYRCQYCPKKLNSPEQLHEHMTECKVDRVHECAVCGKRFKARGGLQQHMRIHEQIKPFACQFCPKRFTQKSHIDQHIRIHTGAKPFQCRYCGRLFRQRSQQMGHENTHFNQNGGRIPLPLQTAECESSPIVTSSPSVPSPYAPIASLSSSHQSIPSPHPLPPSTDNIVSLLALHPGVSQQLNIPVSSFDPSCLVNTTH